MKSMASRPKVAPLVQAVRSVNGEQAVMFKNGSRILFGARESGFGRGFARVDVLVLDEAQILTENAMSDMVPATNAAANGLVLLMGTPPRPKDPGEVFANRRADGLAGDADTLYVEFSADREATADDWGQLAVANPSFPHRTSKTAILRMKKLLGSDDNFRREAMGIWDVDGSASRGISEFDWLATAVDEAPEGVRSLAVAFSKDGDRQAVAGAVKYEAGVHVELVGAYSGPTEAGVASLADWLAARWRRTARIAICGRAASASLEDALRERGVPRKVIHVMTTGEYLASCQLLLDGIREGAVTHPRADADDALEESVACTDRKWRGQDGAWGWQATTEAGDETPVEAVGAALWAARTSKRVPGRKGEVLV
ncbi:MAG: terminase [Actinomycetaceae bacterium]|nr:terminase [Actinomycetaceae bacterium]